MKKANLILSAILLVGFAQTAHGQHKRTEEYAMIDVYEQGRVKTIRVTVADKPTVETEWKREKTSIAGDMTPVLNELAKLNEQGFEIVNMSLVYTTVGGGSSLQRGVPRHSFLMVRKIE